MKETIAEMLKVEAQAKKIVADADAEAARIVQEARRQAIAAEDAARREAQAKAARRIEEGIVTARARRDQILGEIDQRAATLRQVTPEKAEAARELVLAALTGQ